MPETPTWTDQTAFEFAARKVIEQRKPLVSLRDTFGAASCLYRGPDGLRCHIGWLIPDSQYDEKLDYLDGSGVEVIVHRVRSLRRLNINCLVACQRAHDIAAYRVDFIANYASGLRQVAKDFNLDASFLDALVPVAA